MPDLQFTALGLHRSEANVGAANTPSERLLLKLAFYSPSGGQPSHNPRTLSYSSCGVGAHGADAGARGILSASRIGHVLTKGVRRDGAVSALCPTLDALTAYGVARVYVHLDVDVLDAAYAPANQFAPVGGLLPDHVLACVEEIARRFSIAAATVASYDPTYDREDRILHAALGFLTLVASTFRSA